MHSDYCHLYAMEVPNDNDLIPDLGREIEEVLNHEVCKMGILFAFCAVLDIKWVRHLQGLNIR